MTTDVLLASYAFPPLAMPESYVAAKGLGNLPDHEVHVIAAERVRQWIPLDPSLDEYVAKRFADVRRVGLPRWTRAVPFGRLPLLAIPDLMVHANRAVVDLARDEEHDVLVTRSQWHAIHLAGLRLKQARPRTPWIAQMSDPWVDNAYADLRGILRTLNARQEAHVIGFADRVVFTSEATRELVMSKYPPQWAAKARVIPHAYDPILYPGASRPVGSIVVRYLGGFYGPRTPAPLFDALALLQRDDPAVLRDVRVELVGSVPREHLGGASLRSLPSGLVTVLPSVPYARSLALMVESDLLLVVDAPAARSVFLPSKLIDYIGAARPIVGITSPGAAQEALRALGAPVADPASVADVAVALRRGLELARKHRGAPWGDESARRRYHVDTTAREMAMLMREAQAAVGA